MYKVVVTLKARKELKKISRRHQKAVVSALEELQETPSAGKALKKELTGKFSYRVGVFRIIYTINKKDKVITVLTAGHRATIYGASKS